MSAPAALYHGHRFPPALISYAVYLYYRFAVSYRDVEELLALRGIGRTRTSITAPRTVTNRLGSVNEHGVGSSRPSMRSVSWSRSARSVSTLSRSPSAPPGRVWRSDGGAPSYVG